MVQTQSSIPDRVDTLGVVWATVGHGGSLTSSTGPMKGILLAFCRGQLLFCHLFRCY